MHIDQRPHQVYHPTTAPEPYRDRYRHWRKGRRHIFLNQMMADSRGVDWYYVNYNGEYGWVSSKYTYLYAETTIGAALIPSLPDYGSTKGSLKAEVTYDTTDGKAPTFQNVYTPSAITVELKGEKTLKGRDLKADEFSFQITDSKGNVVATAKNDAKGQIVFSAITLKTEGKYTLTVTEVRFPCSN